MKTIALATDSEHPDLTDGDRKLLEVLRERGHDVEPVVWDSEISWEEQDVVIIRSTWDYTEKLEAYRDWLHELQEASVEVWNPPEVLLWNADKMYLKDLRKSGHSIVPSVFLPQGTSVPVGRILEEKDWSNVVIKPMVGAGASDLRRFDESSLDEAQEWLDRLVENFGAIVQPFLEAIRTDGEWSFVFFNREYQYAVKKYPEEGDYRVQSDLGGTRDGVEAPDRLIEQASDAINSITKPFLYARVDAIEQGGRLRIIEIEMIEPDLYLEYNQQGPESFADAVETVLEQGASIDYFQHAEVSREGPNGENGPLGS